MKKAITFFYLVVFIGYAVEAQWQKTNGPYGGDIYSLAKDGSNIFAGTANGVFLSSNDGNSWTGKNNGLMPYSEIIAIAISGNNIFAVDDYFEKVYRSQDYGNSWNEINNGMPTSAYYYSIAIF